jgi:acetoin utilization deacetylase AcuC-like enzyme
MKKEQRRTVGLAADPACKGHDTGFGHPESPARFDAVLGTMDARGLVARMTRLEPLPVRPEDLLACHGAAYVEAVREDVAMGRDNLRTGDTVICSRSLDLALLAVGQAMSAVAAVAEGSVDTAFCLSRPPGHHAMRNLGMGFCIFNNAAIAARYAQRAFGMERVVIVDWDVHHGNGTQDIFYDDPSVFYFSTHQAGMYPGTGHRGETGKGEGTGTTLNVPLPGGAGRAAVMSAFEGGLIPAMEQFKPDFVFVSAGFDSRVGDPLGDFRLTDDDFRDLTGLVMDVAGQYAGGRVVSLLEGGYDLVGLGQAATAHVEALMGLSPV